MNCPNGQISAEEKRAASILNAGAGRYGRMDPASWGWRRPAAAEIEAERLGELESLLLGE